MKRIWKKKKQVIKKPAINLFIRTDKRRNIAINEWITKEVDWDKATNYQLDLDHLEEPWQVLKNVRYFLYEDSLLVREEIKEELKLIICDIEALTPAIPNNIFNNNSNTDTIDTNRYQTATQASEKTLQEKINSINIKEINHEITI